MHFVKLYLVTETLSRMDTLSRETTLNCFCSLPKRNLPYIEKNLLLIKSKFFTFIVEPFLVTKVAFHGQNSKSSPLKYYKIYL